MPLRRAVAAGRDTVAAKGSLAEDEPCGDHHNETDYDRSRNGEDVALSQPGEPGSLNALNRGCVGIDHNDTFRDRADGKTNDEGRELEHGDHIAIERADQSAAEQRSQQRNKDISTRQNKRGTAHAARQTKDLISW